MYKIFYWLHIPSKETGKGEFDQSHFDEIGAVNMNFNNDGVFQMDELSALRLMNKWNNSSDWKYWV